MRRGPQYGTLISPTYLPVTFAILTTIALTSYNALAVTVALPTITTDLGNVVLVPWVVTGFLLAATIGGVVVGPLVDGLGARTTFRLTIVSFVTASAACALAPTMSTLVALRVFQGLAGGMLVAVSHSAIGLAYPPQMRPRAVAAVSVVWGVNSVGSPAIAAVFIHSVGWRGLFVLNVPLGLLAGAAAWRRLPEPIVGRKPIRLDHLGLVLLIVFTVVLLVAFSNVTSMSFVPLGVAVILGAAYWLWSGRSRAPILARRHFAKLPFSAVNIGSGAIIGAVLGGAAYVPLYVTGSLGYSATVAALSVLLVSIGWAAASVAVGRLTDQIPNTAVALAGYLLALPALVAPILIYNSDTSPFVVFGLGFIQGLGVGAVTNSLTTCVWSLAHPDEVGRATAAYQYTRQLLFTYGAAIFGSVLLWRIRRRIGDVEAVRDVLDGDNVEVGSVTAAAIAAGMQQAYIAAVILAALGLFAVVSLQRHMLPREHGLIGADS